MATTSSPAPSTLSSFADEAIPIAEAASTAAAAATMATSPVAQPTPQSLLDGPFWIGAIALVGLLLLLAFATCLKRQYEDDLSRCRLCRWKPDAAADAAGAAAAAAEDAVGVGGYRARRRTGLTVFECDLEAGEFTPEDLHEDQEATAYGQSPTLGLNNPDPTAERSAEEEAAEAAEAEAAIRALADEVASRLARRAGADGSVLFTVNSIVGEYDDLADADEGRSGDRRCSSRRRAFAHNRTTTMASAGTSESAATAATAVESSSRRRHRRHRRSRDRSVCGGSRSCVDFAATMATDGTVRQLARGGPGGEDDWNAGSRRRRRQRRCHRCCREEAEVDADLRPQAPARAQPEGDAAENRRRLLDRLVRQASAGCTCRRCWRRFQAEVQALRAKFHGDAEGEADGACVGEGDGGEKDSCCRSRRRRSSRRSCRMGDQAEAPPPPPIKSSCSCSGNGDSGVASWLLAQQPTAAEARSKVVTAGKCNSIEDMSCAAAKAAAAAVAAADEEEDEEAEAESEEAGNVGAQDRRRSCRSPRRPGRERRRRRSASVSSGGVATGGRGGRVEELASRRLERFRAELRRLCETSLPRPPPPKLLLVPPVSSTAPLATLTTAAINTIAKTTGSTMELTAPRLASPTPSLEDIVGGYRSPIVAGDTFIYVEDWSRRATESHSAILPAVGRQLRRRRLLRLRRRALDDDDEDEDYEDAEAERESRGDTVATGSTRQTPTSDEISTPDHADRGAVRQVQLPAVEAMTLDGRQEPRVDRLDSCASSQKGGRPASVKARLGDSAYQTKENSADLPARTGGRFACDSVSTSAVDAQLRLAASKLQEAARGSDCCCCCCNRSTATKSCCVSSDNIQRSAAVVPDLASKSIATVRSVASVAKQSANVADLNNSRSKTHSVPSVIKFTKFEEELEIEI